MYIGYFGFIRLQWGRADEGAETLVKAKDFVKLVGLQWGRADEGAETYDHLRASR